MASGLVALRSGALGPVAFRPRRVSCAAAPKRWAIGQTTLRTLTLGRMTLARTTLCWLMPSWALATTQPLAAATLQTGTGVVAGRVEVDRRPPRRTANRYASGNARPAPRVQRLRPLVYLRGDLPSGAPSILEIAQQDTVFVPSVLALTVGSTVTFENADPFFHNVFSYSKIKRFDLGRYREGQAKEVTFDEPGVVTIYCEVHDFMRASVLVLDNPYHTLVAEDGTFRLTGVPPGQYELVAWHADLGEQSVPVRVTAGQTARVEVALR